MINQVIFLSGRDLQKFDALEDSHRKPIKNIVTTARLIGSSFVASEYTRRVILYF